MQNIIQKNEFIKIFGSGGSVHSFMSPARVNLIGEHTDYNGGYVFPASLDFGTYGLARKRDDNTIRLYSKTFGDVIEIELDNLEYNEEHDWANYVKGVIKQFVDRQDTLGGFELYIDSNMPVSSGLSSSASLEVLCCNVLRTLFNVDIDNVEIAVLSQKAENVYMGLNCGIMDQFIIANGKAHTAMLLKCDTLQYEYAPIKLSGYKILICNTKKPRNLIESKYNERLEQCKTALNILQKYCVIDNLAQVTPEMFEEFGNKIEDEVIRKRAKHVVYETERTLKSKEALDNDDLEQFGKYMNASHESLRYLYEVTGVELDTMVELLMKEDILGARMTGAGFGGCAICLVHQDNIETVEENVKKEYIDKIGFVPEFYVAHIGDGAQYLGEV